MKGVIRGSRGTAGVFVDETTKKWLADHRAGRWLISRVRLGRTKVEASVGSVLVVVLDVFLEDGFEVTSTADQSPVETFVADGAHEPFGEGIGAGYSYRVRITRMPSPPKTASNARVNFVSRLE